MTQAPPTEEAIFQAALEKPTRQERVAYVEGALAGDEALRQRVLELLASHDASRGPLDMPPAGLGATVDIVTEKPGMQIGPYKLLQQIGEGGMGVVYMAEQFEPVKRRVALKIIKPGMDTRQVIARFEAERQALSLMDHPNIAKVLDAGTTESGRPYFVMELVKGQPITEYCDDKHLTPRQRLELLLPVCQAIQHAHQKGIIHRDIKPTNILVAEYDQKAVPKVIDFGVAKATSQTLTEKTMFTGFGQIVGTLEYMSPEQAKVNQLDIDTRSDIYSLGVLIYELLTGSTPFDKERLRSAGWDEMLRIIREEEPEKPSTRLSDRSRHQGAHEVGPRAVAPDGPGSVPTTLASIAALRQIDPARLTKLVRGEIDWIVMKALEKDRSRRYETASGLAADIERYLSDEPVLACPPSTGYRLQKFVQRNKRGVVVATLVLSLLVLLVSSIGWALRERAVIAAEREKRQESLEQKLLHVLDEVEVHYGSGRLSEAQAELRQTEPILADGAIRSDLEQSVRRWRKDLEMVALLEKTRLERATVSVDGKWDLSAADLAYTRAFKQYGLDFESPDADDFAQRLGSIRIAAALAVALDDWANVRWQLPNHDEASWRRLVAAAQAADPDPLRNQLRNLWGREIEEAWTEIEQLAVSVPGQTLDPTTVILVAQVLNNAGLYADAEALLRERQERCPGDFWINMETGYHVMQRSPGKWAEGEGFYRAALAVRPGNALVRANLGNALMQQGKSGEAERAFREAIRQSPNNGRAHAGLGSLYWKQGRWSQAITAFEEAIRVEPDYAYSYGWLSRIYSGCPELALRDYPRALEFARKGAMLQPESSWDLQYLGWAEYRMGNWQAAVDALEKSCQLQDNGGRGDAYQWLVLALANHQLGRTEEARRWYVKSVQSRLHWPGDIGVIKAEAEALLGVPQPSLTQEPRDLELANLSEAIEKAAGSPKQIDARAHWLLAHGQFADAERDFERLVKLQPENHWHWYYRACLLAYLDKELPFRLHCRAMLQQFANAADGDTLDRTTKSALLLPNGIGGDAEALAQRAEQNLKLVPDSSWAALLKGMAEFRAGRYEQAIEWLEKCRAVPAEDYPARPIAAAAYLAIARHQLTQTEEASALLEGAIRQANEVLAQVEKGGDLNHGGIENWLIAQIALREAKGIILDQPLPVPAPEGDWSAAAAGSVAP
jgi:serine/threonine protein kinase/Flp pilus assembly protein TadD